MFLTRSKYLLILITIFIISLFSFYFILRYTANKSIESLHSNLEYELQSKVSKIKGYLRPIDTASKSYNCPVYYEKPSLIPVLLDPILIGQEKIVVENSDRCHYEFTNINQRKNFKIQVGSYTKSKIDYLSVTVLYKDNDLRTFVDKRAPYSFKGSDWFHIQLPGKEQNQNIYIAFSDKKQGEDGYRGYIYHSKKSTNLNFSEDNSLLEVNDYDIKTNVMVANLYCTDKNIINELDCNQYIFKFRIEMNSSLLKIDSKKGINVIWHNADKDQQTHEIDTRKATYINNGEQFDVKTKFEKDVLSILEDHPGLKRHEIVLKLEKEVIFTRNFESKNSQKKDNGYISSYIDSLETKDIYKINSLLSIDNKLFNENLPYKTEEYEWNDISKKGIIVMRVPEEDLIRLWKPRLSEILKNHILSLFLLLIIVAAYLVVILRIRKIAKGLTIYNSKSNYDQELKALESLDGLDDLEPIKKHCSKDEIGVLANGIYDGLRFEIIKKKTEIEKGKIEKEKRKAEEAKSEANRKRYVAEEEKRKAVEAEIVANKRMLVAEEEKRKAEEAKSEAIRKRYVAEEERRKAEKAKTIIEKSKRKETERLSGVLYHDVKGTYGPELGELIKKATTDESIIKMYENNLSQIINLVIDLRMGMKISASDYDVSHEGTILEAIQPCIERHRSKITNKLSKDFLSEVVISSDQLDACIEQIVSNALNFIEDGSSILIEEKVSNDEFLYMVIKNKGNKIEERLLKNNLLFKFGKSGRGSSGIGLWATRKRIESIGGSIIARNNPPYVEFELKIKPVSRIK